MKLFKIQVQKRNARPCVLHWQVLDSIPPISTIIEPGLYTYSENTILTNRPKDHVTYVIDIDYTPPITDLKDPFMIYKIQLMTRLKSENFI
jgi:hypothetical protein